MNNEIEALPNGDFKINALGEPAPNRTDFTEWSREGLEKFARQVADENLVLRTENKALLGAWRKAVATPQAVAAVELDSSAA